MLERKFIFLYLSGTVLSAIFSCEMKRLARSIGSDGNGYNPEMHMDNTIFNAFIKMQRLHIYKTCIFIRTVGRP